MKKSLFTLLAMMLLGTAFAQPTSSYFQQQFDASVYEDYYALVAAVSIDGVIQNDYYLELGAWDEVHQQYVGGALAEDYSAYYAEGPEYWMNVYGYPAPSEATDPEQSIISFRLYNHETGQVLDYVCTDRITWTNGSSGLPNAPRILNFISQGQDMYYTGQGNWNDVANWKVMVDEEYEPAGRLPIVMDHVIIEGSCTMSEEFIGQYADLTIEDGGQLFAPEDAEIYATVKKVIQPYTLGEGNNWYLLSIPVDVNNQVPYNYEEAGMLTGNYDFFYYSQDFPGTDIQNGQGEWRNYKVDGNEPFKAVYNGYLYANSALKTLSFSGTLYTAAEQVNSSIIYNADADEDQIGVNLMGNPYPCNASVVGDRYINYFYKMNEDRTDLINIDEEDQEGMVIAPATAVFAVADRVNARARVTFEPTHSEGDLFIRGNAVENLKIELTADGILKDRVYIKVGEGNNCPKFNINKNSTKIYVPMNGKKYAAAYKEDANVMALCFSTVKNGIYTLNFNTKNMNCSYLHLIDNVTGADIDLFQTSSYTFNSSDSNYANRFKLVFDEQATNEIAENFAFISNGELMINNSGNATLQIMDITGRILSTENIQNCYSKSLNLSAGVYVVRLSNGNDVKAQKIVVE